MPAMSSQPIAADPRLERLLRDVVLLAMIVVACAPGARGSSVWFGALPLWLLGMPLLSWWALHRFRLPRLPRLATADTGGARRPRRTAVQARRHAPRRGSQPRIRAA